MTDNIFIPNQAETPAEAIKTAEEMQNKPLEVIHLTKQADGNWKCRGEKNGKIIETRAVKPEDALGGFLTQG